MSDYVTWEDAGKAWNLAFDPSTDDEMEVATDLGYDRVPTDMSGADIPSVQEFPLGQNVPPQQMDMLDQIGQAVADVARPIVEPFLAGSPTENPVARGVAEAGLEKIPNSIMGLMNDVEQIIGTVPQGTEATKMPDIVGKSEQYPQAQELVSQFASFLGPFAAMRGFSAPLASLQSFEAGAVADFLMEPGKGGLATMARELGFDNELTQFLDSKVGPEEDTAAKRLEARAKQALEGAGITGVVEGGIKMFMNLAKTGKDYLTNTVFRAEDFGPETPRRIDQPVTMNTTPIRTGIEKLDKAVDQREMGLVSSDEVADLAAQIVEKRRERKQIKEWLDEGTDTPKRRGASWAVAKLREHVAKNEIPVEEADVAEWLVKKNPAIADDMAVSVRTPKGGFEEGAAGMYSSVSRLVTLFKGGAADTQTGKVAMHEFLHHTENMMPEGLRTKIAGVWKKRLTKELEAAWDSGNKERYKALLEQIKAQFNTDWGQEAARNVAKYKKDGVLTDADYQFTNASEFWTVNGTEILSGKYGREGWIGKAKQYYKEMLEFLKDRLGFDNNNALYQGVRKVLSGKQIVEGGPIAKGSDISEMYTDAGAFLNGN